MLHCLYCFFSYLVTKYPGNYLFQEFSDLVICIFPIQVFAALEQSMRSRVTPSLLIWTSCHSLMICWCRFHLDIGEQSSHVFIGIFVVVQVFAAFAQAVRAWVAPSLYKHTSSSYRWSNIVWKQTRSNLLWWYHDRFTFMVASSLATSGLRGAGEDRLPRPKENLAIKLIPHHLSATLNMTRCRLN